VSSVVKGNSSFFFFNSFHFFHSFSLSYSRAHRYSTRRWDMFVFLFKFASFLSPSPTDKPSDAQGGKKKNEQKRSLNHVQGHWLIDRLNNARRSTGVAISIIIARPSDNLFLCFILIFLSPPPLCFPFPFARLAL